MQKESLTALVRHHLETASTASTASSGRSAHTIYGGHGAGPSPDTDRVKGA